MGYGVPAFSRSLWNPDEPRIANIGWAMSRPGGDWLVERINGGEPFLQEPPLFDWLVAISFRLSGVGPGSDWAPRLPAIAFALLTLLLVGISGQRLFGAGAGFIAALVLASTVEYLEIANRAAPDGLLAFLVAVGGIQLLWIAGGERVSLGRAAVLGAAAGLAFMTKNLLGPAFLGLIAAAVAFLRRDLLRQPRTWAAAGLSLLMFAAVALPWLSLVHRRDPALLQVLLWDNTVRRFDSAGRHDPNLFEFLGRNSLNLLPWVLLLVPALLIPAWRKIRRLHPLPAGGPSRDDSRLGGPRRRAVRTTLLAWIALPVLLVLLSDSKRDLYLISIYPALALLAGAWLAPIAGRPAVRVPASGAVIAAGGLLVATALLGGLWVHPVPEAVFAALVPGGYVLYRWARGRGWRSPRASVAAALILVGLAMASGTLLWYRVKDGSQSYVPVGRELSAMRSRGIEVCGYRLGLREVNAAGYYLGEWIPNFQDPQEAAARLARGDPPVVVVVEKNVFDEETSPILKSIPMKSSFKIGRSELVILQK